MPVLGDTFKKWLLGGLVLVLVAEITVLAAQRDTLGGLFPALDTTPPDISNTLSGASESQGAVVIKAMDEFGNVITGLTQSNFTAVGETHAGINDFEDQGDGNYILQLVNFETYTVSIHADGYVSNSSAFTAYKLAEADSYEGTELSMEYAYKVKVWDGTNTYASSTVTAGDLTTACSVKYDTSGAEDLAVYVCLVPLSQTDYQYKVVTTGYETMTGYFDSDRTANNDPSQTVEVSLVIPEGVDTHTYTDSFLTVEDSLGNKISGLTESDFDVSNDDGLSVVEFEESASGVYRFNLQVTNTTSYAVTVNVDGYLSQSTTLSDNIPDGAYSVSLPFGYSVTPENASGTYVSGATVTAASNAVTCSEDTSGKTYNCIVPLSNTDLSYNITASGYNTYAANFSSDRALNADAAVEATPTLTTATTTPAGVTVTESSGSTAVTEGSTTDSYTVALNTAPTADVTITVTPDAQTTVSPATLTFTATNWATAQTVTVTAVNDTTVEGTHSGVIKHTATSTDTHYNGITISGVTATLTDNDSVSTDTDGDGLTDTQETTYGTSPTDSDSDDDGLNDYAEVITYKTNPLDSDSDNGGITDGTEVTNGTDPLDSSDDQNLRDAIISSDTCEDPFTDTKNHWAEGMICRLYQSEVVIGRTNTLFYPNSNITRAEWLKIILLNSGLTVDDAYGLTTDFNDVDEGDWYYPYVALGEDLDVIRTRDFGKNWNPNDYINRADAVLWAVRLAGKTSYSYKVSFDDVNENAYYAYAIAIASQTTVDVPNEGEEYVIEGYSDGTFRPENYIARSEAAAVALRIHEAWYSTSSK